MISQTVYLLLGSNLGNSLRNIQSGISILSSEAGIITKVSHVYRSPAWGVRNQPDYLNAAAELQTVLEPLPLLLFLEEAERSMGRIFKRKMESRTLDIDILFYGNLIVRHTSLSIPHPRMHLRRFALVPMAELNAQLIHPVFNKSIFELLEECDDKSDVMPVAKIEWTAYSK